MTIHSNPISFFSNFAMGFIVIIFVFILFSSAIQVKLIALFVVLTSFSNHADCNLGKRYYVQFNSLHHVALNTG